MEIKIKQYNTENYYKATKIKHYNDSKFFKLIIKEGLNIIYNINTVYYYHKNFYNRLGQYGEHYYIYKIKHVERIKNLKEKFIQEFGEEKFNNFNPFFPQNFLPKINKYDLLIIKE